MIYDTSNPHRDPPSGSPSNCFPISLVPKLIGPPLHCLNSFVPHLSGPQSHWAPIPLVPLFVSTSIICPSQWSTITLVPHLIASPLHWSPIPLVPQRNPSYTVLRGPPISLVPQCTPGYSVLICPPPHGSINATFVALISLVIRLIGLPTLSRLHSPHWSPIPLVPI